MNFEMSEGENANYTDCTDNTDLSGIAESILITVMRRGFEHGLHGFNE